MQDFYKEKSSFEEERIKDIPRLPRILSHLNQLVLMERASEQNVLPSEELASFFPLTSGQPEIFFQPGKKPQSSKPLKIGVVLSGGQAPGGHNVIGGIFEGMKQLNSNSSMVGFLGGSSGIIEGRCEEITSSIVEKYRNTGGFDMIGSGRTKIESEQQLESSLKIMQRLQLDGLVVIGGDDSNTNAAILAEFFLKKKCPTKVIGVPKTIDGDLKNSRIETPFGFDTATKVYSELIGNIARDALSAKKYYHFIKLMGRSASHVALECALQTHPNFTLIGEEIAVTKKALGETIREIVDLIIKRSEMGKDYGVILIPEGLIEFIPEMKGLIRELNLILHENGNIEKRPLSPESRKIFEFLSVEIRNQLLMERDPHGNIQVSQIATEQLLVHKVREALKQHPKYKGKFQPVHHFFGYEGRSGFPSEFDSQYCYALGHVAALLIDQGKSGYMSCISHLTKPVEEWEIAGIPIVQLMHLEERKAARKPVIQKTLVDLNGEPFAFFIQERENWKLNDHYRFPGPIQYGSHAIAQSINFTLQMEHGKIKATIDAV